MQTIDEARKILLKRISGLLLLLSAIPLAALAGAGAFIVLVYLSPRLMLAGQGMMLGFLLVLSAIAWWGMALVSGQRRLELTLAVVTLGLLLFIAFVGSIFFRSMDFPYTPAEEPPGVAYWHLTTGSRIAYLHTQARGESTHSAPVIFVHGGPGLPELMAEDVRVALAESGFDVYAYHQFGAGLSNRATDREREYTVARHVADLEAIRGVLEAEQLILVGQSWGATLSASYAAAHPSRVAKLALTAPGPSWLPAFDADQIRVFDDLSDDDFAALGELVRPLIGRLALHRLLLGLRPETADQFLSERQLDAYVAVQGRFTQRAFTCDPAAAMEKRFSGQGYWVNYHVFADLRRVADPRPMYEQVEAPVLILKPECDYVDWPVALDFRDRFPNAVLLRIEGAGHEIRWERPDMYLDALTSFFTDRGLPLKPYLGAAPDESRDQVP